MPRLGLEDIPKAGLIRSDQFLMFAILFMACMISSWATTRPAGSLVDGGQGACRGRGRGQGQDRGGTCCVVRCCVVVCGCGLGRGDTKSGYCGRSCRIQVPGPKSPGQGLINPTTGT